MAQPRRDKLQDLPQSKPSMQKLSKGYVKIIGKSNHSKLTLNVVQKIQNFKIKVPADVQPYLYSYLIAATQQENAQTFDVSSYRHIYMITRGNAISPAPQ